MTDVPSNQKQPDPCSFVIFGVTGDLAHRLVIPALYNLAATGLLPDKFCVVGVTRKGMPNDELRDGLMKGLREFATRPVDDAIATRLLECVTCIAADPTEPASFDKMRQQIEEEEDQVVLRESVVRGEGLAAIGLGIPGTILLAVYHHDCFPSGRPR